MSSKPIPISSITSAAAEFTRLARANADFTRATTADALNKHGRRLKQLVKGDYVKIYAPPSHKEAVDRRRKQKHIVQWRGPMLIEEKMSNTCFRLSDHCKPNATYERNLTNMRPWVGPIPTAPPDPNAQGVEQSIGDIEVGDLVLARDSSTSRELDLAEVSSITDDCVTLACYGTRSASLAKAKFHEVYTKGEDIYLGKPSKRIEATRWTWMIQHEDVADLIPAHGLTLNRDGRLSKKSRILIAAIKPTPSLRTF